MLVRETACLTAPLPCVRAVLAYLGRATMPIVILHFLSFKLVTWLGLLATGGEPYLLAAFPIYFTAVPGGLPTPPRAWFCRWQQMRCTRE